MCLFRTIFGFVNLAVVALFLLTAWGGNIDPSHHPYAGTLSLALPIMSVAIVVTLLIDLAVRGLRRLAVLPALAVIASFPAMLSVFPLNLPQRPLTPDERTRSFTMMTYNVIDFKDLNGRYPGGVNPTVSKIIADNADVVCLQEAEYLCAYPPTHFTDAQVDTLTRRYPWILLDGKGLCLLSRFPARCLMANRGDRMAVYRLEIMGRNLTVFNVHLQSLGLTAADKRITRMRVHDEGTEIDDVVTKIAKASKRRACEVTELVSAIRLYGGPDYIVTGDFNDVPGCWALRQLQDMGMREVWPSVGLGYKHTYNRNRLYFTLDHMLWHGDFSPRSAQRGNNTNSDHYPLLVTFTFDSKLK